MDILEAYEELISGPRLKSCFDLKYGDMIYVKVVPDTFLTAHGVKSGLYAVSEVSMCDTSSCGACANLGCCVYIQNGFYDRKGTCNSHIYDKDGNRFMEDFPYYKEFPTYPG